MDLEGQWNPPEEWPESSPPLPGWTRSAEGLWTELVEGEVEDEADEGEVTDVAEAITKTNGDLRTDGALAELTIRPIHDITPATVPSLESLTAPAVFGTELNAEHPPHRQVVDESKTSKVELSFSDTTADLYKPDEDRDRRQALTAAILAAITASMFAAGLVLLLLLF
jgi:hypothetical protein